MAVLVLLLAFTSENIKIEMKCTTTELIEKEL